MKRSKPDFDHDADAADLGDEDGVVFAPEDDGAAGVEGGKDSPATSTSAAAAAAAMENVLLEQRLVQLAEGRIAPGSRKSYIRLASHFLVWLVVRHPEVVVPTLAQAVCDASNEKEKLAAAKRFFIAAGRPAPIFFGQLESSHCIEYLEQLKASTGPNEGKRLSRSSLNTHRTAMLFLFSEYNTEPTHAFVRGFRQRFLGLLRESSVRSDGKVGKEPISFAFYQWIAGQFLKSNSPRSQFAHAMFVLSWNLMCRVSNSIAIRFVHLRWKEDALGVVFTHQKNDQTGAKRMDPLHVYANPLVPEVCPILALALLWLTCPIDAAPDFLFPGRAQDDRFRRILDAELNTDVTKAELAKNGLSASDVGCHSTRKGSSSFVSSGSTVCPPMAAICLRGGWSLGAPRDRYMRYEAAGDQYVGRSVTGLPQDSPEFALLPPFFVADAPADVVSTAIKTAFPNLPESCTLVGRFALASLVWHRNWLRSSLSGSHPVLTTALFTQRMVDNLASFVDCRRWKAGDSLMPTGIPVHTMIITQLSGFTQQLEVQRVAIEELVPRIVAEVNKILDERAVQTNAVTAPIITKIVEDALEARGFALTHEHPGQVAAAEAEQAPIRTLFFWGGKMHRVPEHFVVPTSVPLRTAWTLWHLGDAAIGPYSLLDPSDFPLGSNERRRFCEFRKLMKRMASSVTMEQQPTALQVQEAFTAALAALPISQKTPNHKERRIGDLKWQSITTELRKK